jgi:cytoskeletal protein RodZ
MKEIGKILREKREQMKMSLSDIHKVIKVHEKYLIAIEEGDMSAFSAEVYYKSFIRSYAKYLGFNPEEIIEMYNEYNLKQKLNNAEKTLIDNSKLVKKTSYKEKLVFYMKKLLIVLIIGIAMVFLFIFLYLNKKVSTSVEITVSQSNEQDEDLNKLIQVVEQTDVTKDFNEQKPSFALKQKLFVEAITDVWLKVYCDNVMVYEGTLLKGDKKTWESNEFFTLRVGYAPGVKVFFNGNQVDVITGAVQDVNTVILRKGNNI